ncbi:sugar-binding domain-containing protein [Saxibacter everestensis]|uniref:Sugar-binding domain-containing protein n=1 Tax=Saxibacter everestensis TaxID=2909229 RepID=A0ABY8QR51_9MICO|nr:sugar-binding domain-containing protein [Brevibacteriaceae bacterium ZFBP1038]
MTDSPGISAASSRFPLETLYQAARMYYLDDATQVEIAAKLRVSRPTVSRFLAEARRVGLVQIDVIDPQQANEGSLGHELADALGLQKVYLSGGNHSAGMLSGLSAQVGAAIEDMQLVPGNSLLVSSGRTLYEVSRTRLPSLAGIVLAPTVGGQAEPEPWYQTNEITRAVAEKTGAHPTFLFAQAMPSAQLYQSLLSDPSFQRVTRLWDTAKGALLGIGAPPAARGSISRFIPLDDDSLVNAVGDVCLNFFAADGTEIEFTGSDRVVRTSPAMLRKIEHTVGVAVGAEKTLSIIAAAKGGYIRQLVTDTATADAILALLRRRPAAS